MSDQHERNMAEFRALIPTTIAEHELNQRILKDMGRSALDCVHRLGGLVVDYGPEELDVFDDLSINPAITAAVFEFVQIKKEALDIISVELPWRAEKDRRQFLESSDGQEWRRVRQDLVRGMLDES